MDARNRRKVAQDYYGRFPEAKRLGVGDPIRGLSDDPIATFTMSDTQHRPVAMDSGRDDGWDDFNARFPGAARIGIV
jgi:hypothetical protein